MFCVTLVFMDVFNMQDGSCMCIPLYCRSLFFPTSWEWRLGMMLPLYYNPVAIAYGIDGVPLVRASLSQSEARRSPRE